jgi:hypothetical protein
MPSPSCYAPVLRTASCPASLAGELPSHLQRSMYDIWYLLHLTSLYIHVDWQAVEQVSIRVETG